MEGLFLWPWLGARPFPARAQMKIATSPAIMNGNFKRKTPTQKGENIIRKGENMIKVEHVSKTFTTDAGDLHAVRDVSFQVKKGEIFGIIGMSGAGKSTLVRLINRLEEPTDGKIDVDGVDITQLKKNELLRARKEMGMIFQRFNLFHQKTIWENIAYPLKIGGKPKEIVRERVEELLRFIDLADRKDSYPAELSGGQQQRVAIARALALSPKILLSDEGTSALDPKNTYQVLGLLRKAAREFETTIIMITHQMEVAKDICDRIAVMEEGRIVEENRTRELFLHPQHPTTRAFISRVQDVEDLDRFRKIKREGWLLKLSYQNESAGDPVITDIAKKYDVDISILAGNINTLKESEIGYVLVEIIGEERRMQESVQAFKDHGVVVEVVK